MTETAPWYPPDRHDLERGDARIFIDGQAADGERERGPAVSRLTGFVVVPVRPGLVTRSDTGLFVWPRTSPVNVTMPSAGRDRGAPAQGSPPSPPAARRSPCRRSWDRRCRTGPRRRRRTRSWCRRSRRGGWVCDDQVRGRRGVTLMAVRGHRGQAGAGRLDGVARAGRIDGQWTAGNSRRRRSAATVSGPPLRVAWPGSDLAGRSSHVAREVGREVAVLRPRRRCPGRKRRRRPWCSAAGPRPPAWRRPPASR